MPFVGAPLTTEALLGFYMLQFDVLVLLGWPGLGAPLLAATPPDV